MAGNQTPFPDPLRAARYTSAAAIAIYLYDIFITLDMEVEHIWSRLSFDWLTVLYLINRHLCLVFFLISVYGLSGFHGDFSDQFCKIPFNCIGFTLAYIAWTGIMTMRVTALWGQKRTLVKCIRILWACVLVVIIVSACLAWNEDRVTLSYNRSLKICTTTVDTKIYKANPIAPATYELFLTILTLIKVFEHASSSTLPMLARIIARDGMAYFLVSTALLIVNAFAWYNWSNTPPYLLLSLCRAIGSTVMSRLVLNLRATYSRSISHQYETDAVSASVTFRAPITGKQDIEEGSALKQSVLDVDAWNNRVYDESHTTPEILLKSLDFPERSNIAPIGLHSA